MRTKNVKICKQCEMMRSKSERLTEMCHCARIFFVLVLHTIDTVFSLTLIQNSIQIFTRIFDQCSVKSNSFIWNVNRYRNLIKMKRNRPTQNFKQSKQSKISDFISQNIDKSNEPIEERQNNELSSINENGLFISF